MNRRNVYDDSWVQNWITDEARAAFKARRESASPKSMTVFERLAAGHRRSKRKPGLHFKIKLRLSEIEKIIRSRHGDQLPETDDADLYIKAVGYSLNALDRHDFDELIRGWCMRFAPWALPRAGEIIRPIINDMVRRKYDLHSDEVARLLCLTMAERTALRIKTIGASDMTTVERKRFAKARKQERDRLRRERVRRRSGTQTREEWLASSLSQRKPWEAEGISRRTWERRRVAGPSRIDIDTTDDQPASNPSTTSPNLAAPLAGSPSLMARIGTGSTSNGTGQCDADDALMAMRFATKGGLDAA